MMEEITKNIDILRLESQEESKMLEKLLQFSKQSNEATENMVNIIKKVIESKNGNNGANH